MSKLTEIKQHMETCSIEEYERLYFLLSLLEEKDKALTFYEDEENHKWSHTYDETGEVEEIPSKVADDRGRIARKALNTSSNNEGEK